MDTMLFSSLLQNLLQTNVLCLDTGSENLNTFEEKYCYNQDLQPAFTAQTLSPLLESMQEHILYGIRDDLGICIIFFLFNDRPFIVGPYVKAEFDAVRIQRVLINNHMPASFASSIKLYYSAFPILCSFVVRKTIIGCMCAFTGGMEEYSYCRLHGTKDELKLPQLSFSESLDYSTLYQRYDMENRFLHMVEMGDTENVLDAYRDMNIQGMSKNRYINAVYQDPAIGLSMLRALTRKAAELGGASIVEINEITQRAVQRMFATQHQNEQIRHTQTMIYELTDAVRRHRYQVGDYSEPVKKTAEFLSLNFSQKITLLQLANRVNLSEIYLSRIFKKEVGMTIFQYIAHLRCAQAAEMLKGSDISIQEISNYVGYPDNNYFVKVFKVHYGMTPSEYRAQKA